MFKPRIILSREEDRFVISEPGFNPSPEVRDYPKIKCLELYSVQVGGRALLCMEDMSRQIHFGSVAGDIAKTVFNITPADSWVNRRLYAKAKDEATKLAISRGYDFEDISNQQI